MYRGQTMAVAAAKGDLPLAAMLYYSGEEAGFNMLVADAEGNAPLHYAALSESPDTVAFLLRKATVRAAALPPPVDVRNYAGETPALRAAVAGHVPVLRFLLADCGANLFATDANRNTVLHNAARSGRLWAVIWLLERAREALGEEGAAAFLAQGDVDNHTALEWACYFGHLGVVRVLLREGLDIQATDDTGRTLLHWSCSQGRVALVRYLVRLGLDPDQPDGGGQT
ncbi:unnamed protein product, partial [Phaeothamnion confervicola]